MNSTEELLHLLVRISVADNEFATEEMKYIYEIGINKGMSKEQVEEIMSQTDSGLNLDELDLNERITHLINMVQVMKVDGKVRQAEIEFCEKVAIKMGFVPGVIADLSQHIYTDAKMIDFEHLKKIAKEHLAQKE